MARRGGRRGRRRNRRSSSRSKASSSKSRKSKSRRTSASASRKRARSVSKAARNRRSRTNSTTSTKKKKSRKPSMGRGRHNKGGQHNANKNQNKKAKRTVRSVRKAVSKVAKNVGKAVRNATRGLAANAATHVANSKYNKQLKKANWTKRDMSKLTPQQQRKYQRLSEKTGRDYSMRRPTFRLNLNADTIARFGGFADNKYYKGLTKRFPGIKTLKINKQFYGNPMKKGWHSSQRTGRGQGISSPVESMIGGQQAAQAAQAQAQQQNQAVERQYEYDRQQYEAAKSRMGPQQDWLDSLYRRHNINQGNLDQGARDYWSNEAKTKGRDAVMQSIIGTSKAQGTYGGRKRPQRISTVGPAISAGIGSVKGGANARRARLSANRQNRSVNRRHAKSLAAHTAAIRGI